MKKRLLITTLFLFLLPLCFAAPPAILQAVTSQATVSPLGEATFDLFISNEENSEDIFFLELSDMAWSLRTKNTPDFTTGIALGAREQKNITIFIKPNPDIEAGTYFVELKARSRITKTYASQIFIMRVDPNYVDYSVNINTEIIGPTSIDPQRTNVVKAIVRNPYPVFLKNLTVEATSKFINKKATIDVLPKSEKVLEFSMNIDKSTPQQEDSLKITISQGAREISSASAVLYIKEYKLPYKTDEAISKRFLQTVHTITFTNTEGAKKTQDASIPIIKSAGILLTNPLAKIETFNGGQYLIWTVALDADESYSVEVVEDYRTVTAVLAILIISFISYYVLRSPIILRKKAMGVHKKDTGNNEIKVILQVKNRTGKFVEKVRVFERLPLIHKVDPEFGAGTPEPKFRRHGSAEILLDWDIALAPREERIFTYKIKSALPVVGEYTLKPCVVQYGANGRRVSSDVAKVYLE